MYRVKHTLGLTTNIITTLSFGLKLDRIARDKPSIFDEIRLKSDNSQGVSLALFMNSG